MTTPAKPQPKNRTVRAYKDGAHRWASWRDAIFNGDSSDKCPTYVHRTPPCQGSCPSGEDVRGWLQIVRGIEKPPEGLDWQGYAFRRASAANPFPSIMGRVCPAPCEQGCNRNQVDDFVGINAVEQFIGDHALAQNYPLACEAPLGGRRVAIVGAGPAGLAAACQLRRKGHGSVVFDDHAKPGGMMRYGIPNYRTPRRVLDHEIQRILDLGGIETRMNTRIGADLAIAALEREFDAVLWAIGRKSGRALPIPGGDAPNCVSGVAFLEAFNRGRLPAGARRVVCVGGGDTSIDVVSVARRLGAIKNPGKTARRKAVVGGYVAHDSAFAALREGAEVVLTSLFARAQMTATPHEVEDALNEGVDIRYGVMPVEAILGGDGRAVALRMAECAVGRDGRPVAVAGGEFEVECDLIISAIGQRADLSGLGEIDNGDGFIDASKFYQLPGRPGHFAAGDIIKPHLLTTAIGQASIAADSIDHFLAAAGRGGCADAAPANRPKVDVHHFDLLDKLRESGIPPQQYDHRQKDAAQNKFAAHNYEDRGKHEVIAADKLFLAHFEHEPRHLRARMGPNAAHVLGHFDERRRGLDSETARREAGRCMSCGMCFECDNCVVYCPQNAVFKVKKGEATLGRYVDTDYNRCIGCHICAEVCPTGYIDMGLGGHG